MDLGRLEQLVATWRKNGAFNQEPIDWSSAKANWKKDLPHLSGFIQELPTKLDRNLIKEVFENNEYGLEAKFATVMIWGYGVVGYGSFRTKKMFASADFQSKLEKSFQLSQSELPLEAYRFLSINRIQMLGPTFATKWISFASPQSNPAPIYDSFVSKWFQHFAADAFTPIPISSLLWNVRTYSKYLSWMQIQAHSFNMKSNDLELLIFQDALRSFPNSSKWKSLSDNPKKLDTLQKFERQIVKSGIEKMTVRAEILRAMRILEGKFGGDTFQLKVIRQQVLSQDSTLNVNSINTHIGSFMCANAPKNHAIQYPDLIRVGHGLYRLNHLTATENATAPIRDLLNPEKHESRTPQALSNQSRLPEEKEQFQTKIHLFKSDKFVDHQKVLQPKFIFAVDGSNAATGYVNDVRSTSLADLVSLRAAIAKKFPEWEVHIFVDPGFRWYLDKDEKERFVKLERSKWLTQTPSGIEGDETILEWCENQSACVVSGDEFAKWHARHPWLFEPNRRLSVKKLPKDEWFIKFSPPRRR